MAARMAHNHQVAGSSPAPATVKNLILKIKYQKDILWLLIFWCLV